MAFRRFRPGSSIFGDEWVGLYYVRMFIQDPSFWSAFWNTVVLGLLTLVVVFPLPIILALMLNELRSARFKRLVQTVSYLPHFMSIVIVAGMIFQLTAMKGTFNQIITGLGGGRHRVLPGPPLLVPPDLPDVGGLADGRVGARSSTSRR